jgi:hypothetical protein
LATVDADDPNKKTVLLETYDGQKFQKPLEEYIFDTQFFPPETRIERLQGNIIKTTKEAIITLPITTQVQNDLTQIETKSNQYDLCSGTEYILGSYTIMANTGQGDALTAISLYVNLGATKIKTRFHWYDVSSEITISNNINYVFLPKTAVYEFENDSNYYRNFIRSLLDEKFTVPNEQNITTAAETLKNYSLETMKYHLISGDIDEQFYNYGPIIKEIVTRRYANANNIYIPLYTREIISDEYPTPDCGFTFEIASDMNDSIRWLAMNKHLLIGTETAEWIVPSGVNAVNIQAALNSRYGSGRIQGTAVGDATIFFQAGKKGLVEYYIPQQDNNFRANNMAGLAPQMLRESSTSYRRRTSNCWSRARTGPWPRCCTSGAPGPLPGAG